MPEISKLKLVPILALAFVIIWYKVENIEDLSEFINARNFSKNRTEIRTTDKPIFANYFTKRLEGKGVILRAQGGIGNQLFQYACSYALARDLHRPMYNFVSSQSNLNGSRKFLPEMREFALDKFQIPLNNFINYSTLINRTSLSYLSDSKLLFRNYSENDFLQLSAISYCQSETYWAKYKDDILSMFQLKPEVVQEFPAYVTWLEKEIGQSPESVAVHGRLGDFLTAPGFDVPITYQRAAIHRIIDVLQKRRSNGSSISPPKFFVFSDDIDYAKRDLEDLAKLYTHQFIFVSSFPNGVGNRTISLQDFYLMTKCKHFIVPNSTFSWWAAYLSTNRKKKGVFPKSERIVIASAFNPKFLDQWRTNKEDQNFYKMLHGRMYYPKEWTVINVFEEKL